MQLKYTSSMNDLKVSQKNKIELFFFYFSPQKKTFKSNMFEMIGKKEHVWNLMFEKSIEINQNGNQLEMMSQIRNFTLCECEKQIEML